MSATTIPGLMYKDVSLYQSVSFICKYLSQLNELNVSAAM